MLSVTETHDDWVFQCGGVLYDTSALARFDTGDSQCPAIFATPDGRKAFAAFVSAIGTLSIAPLGPMRLRELAGKYRMDVLGRLAARSLPPL